MLPIEHLSRLRHCSLIKFFLESPLPPASFLSSTSPYSNPYSFLQKINASQCKVNNFQLQIMKRLPFKLAMALTFIGFLAFCSCTPEKTPEPLANSTEVPIAIAGNDALIFLPQQRYFTLDGTGSSAANGLFLSATPWRKLSGPEIRQFKQKGGVAQIEVLEIGIYSFEFTARDRYRNSSTDTVTLTVKWSPECNQTRTIASSSMNLISDSPDDISINASFLVNGNSLYLAGGTIYSEWSEYDEVLSNKI